VVPIPLIAIGGITEADVDGLLDAGAHGVAVISAVCASPDPQEAARALRRRIDARIGGVV
jgi:thiamine monophosphate synthase